MNNLHSVIVAEFRRRPVNAAHNILIQFNRDSFRREVENFDQFRKEQAIRHFPSLTVNLEPQGLLTSIRQAELHGAVQFPYPTPPL